MYRLIGGYYLTAREEATWERWYEEEWKRPSTTHHYLMRIAQRIHQTAVKEPGSVKLGHQVLQENEILTKVKGRAKPPSFKNPEEAAHYAKSHTWGWLMGMARNAPEEYKAKIDLTPQTGPPKAQDPAQMLERRRRAEEAAARGEWTYGAKYIDPATGLPDEIYEDPTRSERPSNRPSPSSQEQMRSMWD